MMNDFPLQTADSRSNSDQNRADELQFFRP